MKCDYDGLEEVLVTRNNCLQNRVSSLLIHERHQFSTLISRVLAIHLSCSYRSAPYRNALIDIRKGSFIRMVSSSCTFGCTTSVCI